MSAELERLRVNLRRVGIADHTVDQVLAEMRDSLWLAEHDRKIRAECLRDAAEKRFYDRDQDRPISGYRMLHDLADQIEADHE